MGSWSFRGKSANLAVVTLAAFLLGAAPTGGVYVTTLPAGADVWIDGTYLGRSPIVLDAVTRGIHRLTLTRTGWSSQDVPVSVVPSTTITTSVVLVRAGTADGFGTIALHGDRVGSITVDGEPTPLGKDGTFAARAGTHAVTVRVPSGKITRNVTVYAQTRTDVVMLGETQTRSSVIAPADDYVPDDAVRLDGSAITVHYGRHDIVAHVGSTNYSFDRRTLTYDAAPTVIKKRVYLPIDLLTLLTADDKR